MPHQLEAVIFVQEPPDIELVDGLFFMRWRFGDTSIERVMLPSTFARFMWRGQQALNLFRSGANVIEIKRSANPGEDIAAAH